MNTPWVPYLEYGAYYRLLDNTLLVAPMIIGGGIDLEGTTEVEFESISEEEVEDCNRVINQLKTIYEEKEQNPQII
jgi:hypothetical protein